MELKENDIVTAQPGAPYAVTNSASRCRVTAVYRDNAMEIELIDHPSFPEKIGMRYAVDKRYFRNVLSTPVIPLKEDNDDLNILSLI